MANEMSDLVPSAEDVLRIDDFDGSKRLIQKIMNESIDYSQLHDYEVAVGLREGQQTKNKSLNDVDEEFLKELFSNKQVSYSINLNDLAILDIFTPDNRTLIYGSYNAGKSYVAQDIAISAVFGCDSFFLKASEPCAIVYFDGELGKKPFWKRIEHLSELKSIDIKAFVERLIYKELRDKKIEEIYEEIKDQIKKIKPKIAIIDNIIKFFREAEHGNIERLMNFVMDLEKAGIAVILIHHAKKDGGTYKGAMEIEALSQNALFLKDRDEIISSFKKEKIELPAILNEEIEACNGPVVGFYGKKCKVCPDLERKTFYYKLPKDGVWQPIDVEKTNRELRDNVVTEDTSCDQEILTCNSIPHELTADEEMIIGKAHEKGFIKTSMVEDLLSCKDSSASSKLGNLTKTGWLIRKGDGRGTSYILSNKAIEYVKAKNSSNIIS